MECKIFEGGVFCGIVGLVSYDITQHRHHRPGHSVGVGRPGIYQ